MVAAGGVAESGTRSRRIFLYVVLGAAVVTLAADLINIIYQSLNGMLQGTFGIDVLRQSKWSLQTLIIALPGFLYHWRVLRHDQRLGAEAEPLQKKVTVLADEPAAELVSQIEKKLGSPLQRLRYLSTAPEDIPALSDEELDKLVGDIQAAPTPKVMVVVTGGKITVLPYQDK